MPKLSTNKFIILSKNKPPSSGNFISTAAFFELFNFSIFFLSLNNFFSLFIIISSFLFNKSH